MACASSSLPGSARRPHASPAVWPKGTSWPTPHPWWRERGWSAGWWRSDRLGLSSSGRTLGTFLCWCFSVVGIKWDICWNIVTRIIVNCSLLTRKYHKTRESFSAALMFMVYISSGCNFSFSPVIVEIPHFGSMRGKERELIVLRSDNGDTWKEHQADARPEDLTDLLTGMDEGKEKVIQGGSTMMALLSAMQEEDGWRWTVPHRKTCTTSLGAICQMVT